MEFPHVVGSVCLLVFVIIDCTMAVGFLIVTDQNAGIIQTTPIDTLDTANMLANIPLEGIDRPIAVDYDPMEHKVYWTDITTRTISRAFINGTVQEVVVSLSGVSNPEGMSLDVENRHIYWTDTGEKTIEKVNMDRTGREVIVPLDDLAKPRAIVVDSVERLMYWTDWGESPKIERARVDGTERVTLVDTDIIWPNGIAIDFTERRMYWCDASLLRIDVADLDGGNRTNLITDNNIYPFDVYVYKTFLYWTDWEQSQIARMDKNNGANPQTVGPLLGTPTGLHIHQGCIDPEIICTDSSACYDPSTKACDGIDDCTDGSDEDSCILSTKEATAVPDDRNSTIENTTTWLTTDEDLSTKEATAVPDDRNSTIENTATPLTTDEVSSTKETTVIPYDGSTTKEDTTTPLTTDEVSSSEEATTIPYDRTTTIEVTTRPLATVADNTPPTLVCPKISEQFAVTDEEDVSVSWPEPVYQDNSGQIGIINSTHTSPSVFGIGNHQVDYTAWDPNGNSASCMIIITVTAACPGNTVTLNETRLTWPLTPVSNEAIYSNERCDVETQNRGDGLAQRACIRDEERGAVWLDPMYIGCGEHDDYDLDELSDTEVVMNNVENVAEALKEETQGLANLMPDDVENIAEVFQNIANVESSSPEVTIALVEVLNNLVNLTLGNNGEDEGTGDSTDATNSIEILRAIENQVEQSTVNGQSFNTTTPNIAIVTTPVNPMQNTPFTFVVLQNEDNNDFREEDIRTYDNNEDVPQAETRTLISLPSSLFNASENGTIGVSFVVHNSDTLFPFNSTNQTVGSDIISAIVVGVVSVNDLPDPVIIEFTVPGSDIEPQCVFWDFITLGWSFEGCERVNYSNDRVTCHCDHLTNFAVLVDISYTDTHVILELVSKIGCGVSMAALLITLVIFIGFRRLRLGSNRVPRLILIHLCTALFLLYLVYLVGIDQISNRNGCIFVAFFLQYLTLVSLTWMGVETINLYLKVIRPFDSQIPNFIIKASCVAWGLPLIVSIISLGAGFSFYNHLNYCFVGTGPPLYYGVVLPIVVILVHNLVIFGLVMRRLCRSTVGGNVTQRTRSEKALKRLQNAFAMSILMGLTWVFGFFAIEDAKFALSLIFCLFNSLQGLALFVLFCARQDDVRRHLRPYYRRLCGLSTTSQPRSQTASTTGGISSTASQRSPMSSPYSNSDFSFTFPMSKTSTGKDDVAAKSNVETENST